MAFGHDEEAQGLDGAAHIAQHLKKKHKVTELEYLLDEGTLIVDGGFPSVSSLVAM